MQGVELVEGECLVCNLTGERTHGRRLGFRYCDGEDSAEVLQQPPWDHWLLVRRSIADPADLACFVVFGPAGLRLVDLARVAGRRWLVEECFEAAKQEVGLADYEVRSWHGWHRHVTLAMLALAFLAGLRARLNAGKGGGEPPESTSCRSASLSFAA